MLTLDWRRTDQRDTAFAVPYWISSALITAPEASAYTGAITAATIAGVSGTPDTLTDSGNGFVTGGFLNGDLIYVSGFTGAGAAANLNFFELDAATGLAAGTLTLDAGETALVSDAAGESVTVVAPKANILFSFPGEGKYFIVHEIVVQILTGLTGGSVITVGWGTIPLETSVTGATFTNADRDAFILPAQITAATPGFYGPTSSVFVTAKAANTWAVPRIIVGADAGVRCIYCSVANAAAITAGNFRVHALITKIPGA